MFWFVSAFLSSSCVSVCVWVWRAGDGCVAGEKVTNAGGKCLPRQVFFPLCCRPEDWEEIQTKLTPVPLPEKCAPAPSTYPPCSKGKVTAFEWGWGGRGLQAALYTPHTPQGNSVPGNTFVRAYILDEDLWIWFDFCLNYIWSSSDFMCGDFCDRDNLKVLCFSPSWGPFFENRLFSLWMVTAVLCWQRQTPHTRP